MMYDVCPYKPNWTDGWDFDALAENWPADINWANCPFSYSQEFVNKALIEFMKGRSVILLLPYLSQVAATGKALLETVAEIKYPGPIRFESHSKALNSQLSMVFLLRPELIESIERRK